MSETTTIEMSTKSEKRKKKKHQRESNITESINEADSNPEPPKKKKKKKKPHNEVEVESKPEEPNTTKRTSKKKKVTVTTSILTETADRIAPVVGYFPSGYSPEEGESPEIRVFRDRKHRSSRVEVVVSPKDSNVEFVGKSYEGEAAVHQPCRYALGVLDRETQTLKVVQIAGNRIFRLEPIVIKSASAQEIPEEQGKEGVNAKQTQRKFSDLTSLYGTKKQKATDKRMRLLAQQTNDPVAQKQLQKIVDADTDEELKDTEELNIPFHDLSATSPEEAYPLDAIVPNAERDYLYDILQLLQSGIGEHPTFWKENLYPSFVSNRIHWLKTMQNEKEKTERAIILSYITHLVNFYKLVSSSHRRTDHKTIFGDATNKYKIPPVICQRFLEKFLPASSVLSSGKKELIISYILVLTLFADKFSSDSSDIAKDLAMTESELKPYFRQLGSRHVRDGNSFKYLWTLPVPLKISLARKRKWK